MEISRWRKPPEFVKTQQPTVPAGAGQLKDIARRIPLRCVEATLYIPRGTCVCDDALPVAECKCELFPIAKRSRFYTMPGGVHHRLISISPPGWRLYARSIYLHKSNCTRDARSRIKFEDRAGVRRISAPTLRRSPRPLQHPCSCASIILPTRLPVPVR